MNTKNNNDDDDNSGRDYPGFPMIQQAQFGANRFCGKKIRSIEGGWATNLHEKRYKTCADGEVTCPDSLCLPAGEKCPISEILLIQKTDEGYDDY